MTAGNASQINDGAAAVVIMGDDKAAELGLEPIAYVRQWAVAGVEPDVMLKNNDLILGAVGPLQFDVVAHRLHHEYNVECQFETVNVATARWVDCADPKMLADFEKKAYDNLALDHGDSLVYIAPTKVNLNLTEERWPEIGFRKTREH